MDFWSPDVWLPTAINSKARIQWSDLEDFAAKGNQISRARDLYAVPFYAVLMLIARFIFEKTFGEWSASFFNIKVGFVGMHLNSNRMPKNVGGRNNDNLECKKDYSRKESNAGRFL